MIQCNNSTAEEQNTQEAKVMWQRLHQMTTRDRQTDGETLHISVTIVCISCIQRCLKMK